MNHERQSSSAHGSQAFIGSHTSDGRAPGHILVLRAGIDGPPRTRATPRLQTGASPCPLTGASPCPLTGASLGTLTSASLGAQTGASLGAQTDASLGAQTGTAVAARAGGAVRRARAAVCGRTEAAGARRRRPILRNGTGNLTCRQGSRRNVSTSAKKATEHI